MLEKIEIIEKQFLSLVLYFIFLLYFIDNQNHMSCWKILSTQGRFVGGTCVIAFCLV